MHDSRSVRIVVADDHTVVREGLISILNTIPGMSVIAQARSWSAAIAKIESYRPEAAILDLCMPDMEATEGIALIRRICPQVRIVLISAFDFEEDIYRVMRAGASGFLAKDCPRQEFQVCLRAVLEGKTWLSPRSAAKLTSRINAPQMTPCQQEVLTLMAAGKTNKEVGAAMNIAEGTVKIHVNQIFKKLGVSGRTAAVTRALERGLVRLSRLADIPRHRDFAMTKQRGTGSAKPSQQAARDAESQIRFKKGLIAFGDRTPGAVSWDIELSKARKA